MKGKLSPKCEAHFLWRKGRIYEDQYFSVLPCFHQMKKEGEEIGKQVSLRGQTKWRGWDSSKQKDFLYIWLQHLAECLPRWVSSIYVSQGVYKGLMHPHLSFDTALQLLSQIWYNIMGTCQDFSKESALSHRRAPLFNHSGNNHWMHQPCRYSRQRRREEGRLHSGKPPLPFESGSAPRSELAEMGIKYLCIPRVNKGFMNPHLGFDATLQLLSKIWQP